MRRIICGSSNPDLGSLTSHASVVSSGWVSGLAETPRPVAVSSTRCSAWPARSQLALPPGGVDRTGDWKDAAVILLVIVVYTAPGLTQEVKAGHAIAALSELTAPEARVIRDGEQRIASHAA